MSAEQALLATIWDRPHDDTPRLVYADWLEETGEPAKVARAEFIRVQCELARVPGDDPRFDALEGRERGLSATWEKGWWAAMPSGARKGCFERGFPVPTPKIPGLLRLTEAKLRAAPLWRYHLMAYARDLDRLLGWPVLHRLKQLALQWPLSDGWAARLAGCPGLRNVSGLELYNCPVTAADLGILLDAWRGRRLTHLHFDPRRLGMDGFRLLAEHEAAASLRDLTLLLGYGERVHPAAVIELFGGRSTRGLIRLFLDGFEMSGEPVTRLTRWGGLAGLRSLLLCRNQLGDADACQLADTPAVVNLRWLSLSGNRIGPAGARALAESPHLAGLTTFGLNNNPASRDEATVRMLRARFGKGLSV